ncbi:MAG: hypothetical protein Ct9H300mP10_08220 [Methanobacteriota archaeon]|nr:MAG: hypothetical protein Ct9H300mP10_08220 [Euryarchaeota archaeon]
MFEFRAFDGIDYSPIIYRTVKLNVQAPGFGGLPELVFDPLEGTVTFEGTAFDHYGCRYSAAPTSRTFTSTSKVQTST